MIAHRLPIDHLVKTRLKELGIRRSELARRCGFKNVQKGIRRIAAVCGGDLDSQGSKPVLHALPAALEVGRDVFDTAIRETADLIAASERRAATERDAAWRAAFKPHAYLIGTQPQASSITIFGFTGGPERWLKIPLDPSRAPVSYALQALAVVRNRPVVPFHGPTTGFIVNYTPDHAVRFDLEGNPIESFPRAYVSSEVVLLMRGRKISAEEFGRILGAVQRS
jgi:hypothetical protein